MPENVNIQLLDDCYNCFNDGITKIDYILVYEDKRATTVDELMVSIAPTVNSEESDRIAIALQKQKDRHRLFKRRFLGNLSKIGLLMETVCLKKDLSKRNELIFCSRMFVRVIEVLFILLKFIFHGH